MKRSLTLLCLLGCYVGVWGSSPRAAQVFGAWSTPVNPGPPLNTASNDNYAVLSKDQLTIYFTSNRPLGVGGDDLWFATRESVQSAWDVPQNMGARINSNAMDSLPFLSSNERILYFYSTRPGPCGSTAVTGLGDIWMTRRRNKHAVWEDPINLGCVLNTSADELAPSFFRDPASGQAWLFYGSNRIVPGVSCVIPGVSICDYDVYASPLGEHGLAGPGVLIPEFSSPGRDTRIFIRKDGLEAFITSNRLGSQGIDIWVSTRDTLSDPWSDPTNLGFPFNSPVDDGAPWLSRDGTTLYFFSTRTDAGAQGGRDIWFTTRMKLHD